jgi:aflatoxin B1 aldehyde reductase
MAPVNVVLGCMTFGEKGKDQVRVSEPEKVQEILTLFKDYGHNELDTARAYGGGTSEKLLCQLGAQTEQNFRLATKCFPNFGPSTLGSKVGYDHSPEGLRKNLSDSMEALGVKKIDIFYLHAPDRRTPFEVTCDTVNQLYKEGHFDQFGLSNYPSWEVAQIWTYCRDKGYLLPTIYQGMYNAITRAIEPELIPCLRKFNIAFYAYNPLAGGFFTGRYSNKSESVESGSRFDPEMRQGKVYRQRYWNDTFFGALELVKPVTDKNNLTLSEVALRWISHHSALSKQYNDAVIIGASSVGHLDQNLKDFEKGPLPQDVINILDEAWAFVKPLCPAYYR